MLSRRIGMWNECNKCSLLYNILKSVLMAINFWQNHFFQFPEIYQCLYLVRRRLYECWCCQFLKSGRATSFPNSQASNHALNSLSMDYSTIHMPRRISGHRDLHHDIGHNSYFTIVLPIHLIHHPPKSAHKVHRYHHTKKRDPEVVRRSRSSNSLA